MYIYIFIYTVYIYIYVYVYIYMYIHIQSYIYIQLARNIVICCSTLSNCNALICLKHSGRSCHCSSAKRSWFKTPEIVLDTLWSINIGQSSGLEDESFQ